MASIPTVKQRSVLPSTDAFPFSNNKGSAALTITGRSLQESGRKIQVAAKDVVDEFERMQAEDNKRELAKLDIELSSFFRSTMYGDGTPKNPGYLNTLGENAVNGFQGVDKAIKEKIAELTKAASNEKVKEGFFILSGERYNQYADQITNHYADQRLRANQAVSAARMQEAANSAISNWRNPQAINDALATNVLELSERAKLEGWGDDVLAAAIQEQNSKTLEGTITAALVSNFGAAKSLYALYGDKLDGVTQASLLDKFDNKARELQAASDRAEARAERNKRELEEAGFDQSVLDFLEGNLDTTEIINRRRAGILSGRDALTMQNLVTQPAKEGPGDADLTNMLRVGILSGQDIDYTDVMGSEVLNSDQEKELINLIASEKKNGVTDNQEYKTAAINLKTILGGGVNLFGEVLGTEDQRQKAANAIYELYDRASAGENIRQVEKDILERYRDTPASVTTLPRPKYLPATQTWGSGNKEETTILLQEAEKVTLEKFKSGEIDENKFKREMKNIEALYKMIGNMSDTIVPTQGQ